MSSHRRPARWRRYLLSLIGANRRRARPFDGGDVLPWEEVAWYRARANCTDPHPLAAGWPRIDWGELEAQQRGRRRGLIDETN